MAQYYCMLMANAAKEMLTKFFLSNICIILKLGAVLAWIIPATDRKGIMFTTRQDTLVMGLDTFRETPKGTKEAPLAITRTKKR